jgi:hypothetical protein
MIFDRKSPTFGDDMKNLFEREATDEVISLIGTLQPTCQRQWGKMDVAQMMAHRSARSTWPPAGSTRHEFLSAE